MREALLAVNAALCAAIGPRAFGLAGDEIGLAASRCPSSGSSAIRCRAAAGGARRALAAGQIPVVAPLAEGPLNVNADEAAAALAVGLGAERIVFVTDVPGVLFDDGVLPRDRRRRGRPAARRRRVRGRDRAEAARRRPCGAQRRARRDRRDGGGRVTVATRAPLLPTYARADVTFVEGEGAWLTDADGRRYLDFAAGIAVVGLGHGHPAPLAAAHAQLDRLWHVSNLYWTEPMATLASGSPDRFGGAQAFFCNSGAEANEAAIKYARKATRQARDRRARGLVPRAHARARSR